MFLLTQDHMALEFSKRYSSYSFHPMSVKRYEDIGYYGGIQGITFLGNRPFFLKKCGTLKFYNGSQWENLKCGISRKRLIVGWSGRRFGTRCPTVHIRRVLLMPDSLSLLWIIQYTLQNFRFYNFQNATSKTIFIESNPNFMRTFLTMGECRLLLFLGIGQVLQTW